MKFGNLLDTIKTKDGELLGFSWRDADGNVKHIAQFESSDEFRSVLRANPSYGFLLDHEVAYLTTSAWHDEPMLEVVLDKREPETMSEDDGHVAGESPDKVKKYLIDFKLTVSTARVIAATSEDEAVRIAEEMIGNDDYWDGIVESMNNDWGNWYPKDADVFCLERVDDGEDADNE
jgi:hypothetical protein